MKLVAENRTPLEAFAFTLLENEVLERDDIELLVGRYMGRPGVAEPRSDREGPRAWARGDRGHRGRSAG